MKVSVSKAKTPHGSDRSTRTERNAAAMPMTAPLPTSIRPLRKTRERIWTGCTTERHAGTEVMGLQRDGIGHDAEEADEREYKSNGGAGAEGNEAEAGLMVGVRL